MRTFVVLVLLASIAPLAAAQASGGIDATVRLDPRSEPTIDAPPGLVRLNDSTPGARYRFDLALTEDHTTLEVRANGLGLRSARQLFPSLEVNETTYPLFVDFPHERIWEVDGPANVAHVGGSGDAIVLRLGVAGPRNVTLRLEVDERAPGYTLGERQNMTHIGFYQETRTDEFALADLQVRRVGATDWIQNPTPEYHVYQRFPVQGLDASTEYETRFVFTDWAGNENVTPIVRFTTPAAPVGPVPVVTIVSPAPNASLPAGVVTIRATVESPASPVEREGIRFFFDLRETTEGVAFDGREVVFTPSALQPGLHRVSIEATNEAGGRGEARWSFTVVGPDGNDTPLPAALALLALVAAVTIRRRA